LALCCLGVPVAGDLATLQPISPWSPGNAFTVHGQIVTKAPNSNTSTTPPTPNNYDLVVDPANKLWIYLQYAGTTTTLGSAQWATANMGCIFQGGTYFNVVGWNYDKQRIGFSYVAEFFSSFFGLEKWYSGPGYDIASCGCEEVATFRMVYDLLRGGWYSGTWFFDQAFDSLRNGVEGVLEATSHEIGTPSSTLTTIPSQCFNPSNPSYCAFFTPKPDCTILQNPTNF